MALYIMIRKIIGHVVLVEPAPGDDKGALYQRAMYKIKKHWAAGELPDVTCWAS
jgi:hypothetical protein